MSMFSKKTYQFAEVIPLQENQSGCKNLFNKIRLPIGTIRRIRVAGDVTVYEFTKANDKTQTATITGDMNNPDADRDWNDDTSADIAFTTPGTFDVRIYDYGEVKERFLYYKFSADTDGAGRLYYSNDGENWTMLDEITSGTVSRATLLTFRYLKFTISINANYVTGTLRIYNLEVFDRDNYTKKTVCTNYAEHEISTLNEPVHVWLEGSLYSYYVYDLKPVKVTVSWGEVEI